MSATAEPVLDPRGLLAMQRSAGNAAATRTLRRRTPPAGPQVGTAGPAAARAGQASGSTLGVIEEVPEERGPGGPHPSGPVGAGSPPSALGLPPYLLHMDAAGLSTAYDLTGHEFVHTWLRRIIGQSDDTVRIKDDLAGRPETFYGRGRTFSVQGPGGWYDVTVTITPDLADKPATFPSPAGPKDKAKATDTAPRAGAASAGPQAVVEAEARAAMEAEGAATKMDAQHNSSAAVSSASGSSSQYGGSVSGIALVPTPAPGVHAGVAFAAGAHLDSSDQTRTTKTLSEPRVLRSEGGTVQVPRKVRYGLRVKHHGAAGRTPAESISGSGTLTMRVPREHLVPVGTYPPVVLRRLDAPTARRVRLADSMAPLAVTDTGATHAGGGGLFDTVGSVLHPSLTAPGAPGRARLYEATSTTSVLEDLPRLLGGWVTGEDLAGRDGSTQGAYRMRADIISMAPAWSIGKTQLRTHQQTQHGAANTAGKGSGGTLGIGPALGLGTLGTGPRARVAQLTTVEAGKMRFSSADQTVNTRQGAEVRGEKVLYRSRVRLTAQGTGPLTPQLRLRAGTRTAEHTIDVLISMRAEEAKALGLELPDGVTAGGLIGKPTKEAADGTTKEAERHLPFGAMGSSVALSQLDTAPLIAGVERLFATDPRLAGYLPEFSPRPPAGAAGGGEATAEEAERQRTNYRELVTVLSETNLRANKDQLLSSGIRVRLRRKTTGQAHDVQIRVTGALAGITYLGDISGWMVRSSSGITSGTQSGRASSRAIGFRGLGQVRIIPGALSAGVTAQAVLQSSRRNQAGPSTRTDSLNNGDADSSSFGATLTLGVQVTMTTRERTAKRAVTLGMPGRDEPGVEHIASSVGGAADNPALRLDDQDVRLTTSAGFTMDTAEKSRLEHRTRLRRRVPDRTVKADGIGDMTGGAWPGSGRTIRDWMFVETVGDGQPIRDLAFQVLARAAGRDRPARPDRAFEAEGLAPRLAVEERFSPQAITAALRQGVTSGWVVKNLRHPRRLTALTGAVGTRFALTRPKVVHKGTGPGTENLVLGGHQVTGQRGLTKSKGVRANVVGMENGATWRLGESLGAGRTLATSTTEAVTLSGTVERNAHTPRKRPHFLVQCDLVVRMVAEVKSGVGGPRVAASERTLPGAAAVWLTREQLEAAGLRDPDEPAEPAPAGPVRTAGAGGAAPSSAEQSRGERSTAGPSKGKRPADGPAADRAGDSLPALAQGLPLGFGMIEDLPDFLPLLGQLRAAIGDKNLAKQLLPHQQLSDPNDNVQRLMRVLDRDGATGLLAGAMDGGVPVELFRGRGTPYWAVFHVKRTGPGTVVGEADDGRDMEYITSAVTQGTTGQEKSDARGADITLAGAGKPDSNLVRSSAAAAGLGGGQTSATRQATVGRGQLGVKTVAEASATSVRVRLPIEASLELRSASGEVASVRLGGRQHLVHRILRHDLNALDRLEPVPGHRVPGQALSRPASGAAPEELRTWRSRGAKLPMEAQVNGLQGAPQVRAAINGAMTAARAGDTFRTTGNAAAYTQREAVSTEWLIAALPLLTSAGVDLPANHASGLEGQDLSCSLHARLRDGKVLDKGDKMTFEAVAQSTLDAPRPTAVDNQQSAEHRGSVRTAGGAGLLNADQIRMNELVGTANLSGGATDTGAAASGSMPLHKPKFTSVLVQFSLEFRIVARVHNRHTQRVRSANASTGVRDYLLVTPVVIRMPEPAVRDMLAKAGARAHISDPHRVFATDGEPAVGAGG